MATELAERGAAVTVIDADPNKNVVDWAKLPGLPANLTVIGDVSEETIVDTIEDAASKTAFVIVDLEGTANLMVSYAISMSDFVIIPVQGSQLDAKQAARQMKLIKAQERIAGRTIPFAVLFTRSNPAIQPKTQRHSRGTVQRTLGANYGDAPFRPGAVSRPVFVRRLPQLAQRQRHEQFACSARQCPRIHSRGRRAAPKR